MDVRDAETVRDGRPVSELWKNTLEDRVSEQHGNGCLVVSNFGFLYSEK